MQEDYKWFLQNYSDLFRKYGDTYLAIKGQKVIGVYHSYAEGVRETIKTEDRGTFIIQHCGSDETAYTNYIASMDFCS